MAYIKHHPHGNVYYFIDAPDKSVRCFSVSIGDNFKTVNIIMEAIYEEYYY